MISSVAFRRFKALRNTSLALGPFNLLLGPNGSGKTSLIEALLRLRTLAALGPAEPGPQAAAPGATTRTGPEILFRFEPPHAAIEARLTCVSELVCDALRIVPAGAAGWAELRAGIAGIRAYLFDHYAMAAPAPRAHGAELASNGHNLAAVLWTLRAEAPAAFAELETEACRILPEFASIELRAAPGDLVVLGLQLGAGEGLVTADNLSQGALYALALLALVFAVRPPSVVCLEEIDRGIHPRRLREVRDLLYRLSYPDAFGLARPPVQVVTTTHSPYLLELFRDHPEEVVLTQKHGREARFARLSDRPDLAELLQDGNLGDLWFSGILGGVPEDEI